MKKKEILNVGIMKQFLNQWVGLPDKENPIPKLSEILEMIGIDFNNQNLINFYMGTQSLELDLENNTELTKVILQGEMPETSKQLTVKKANQEKKYSYLNIPKEENKKEGKCSIHLHSKTTLNEENMHKVSHSYDPFGYVTTLSTPTCNLELSIKYPDYLKGVDETEYLLPDQIEDILLHAEHPLNVVDLYKEIRLLALKPGIIYPLINIQIRKRNEVVEQIEIVNGKWQLLKKNYPNCNVAITREGAFIYNSSNTMIRSTEKEMGAVAPIEVGQTRSLVKNLFEE